MNRFEESKEVFNKLFGKLPDANTEIDHELMEILRKFIFGDVFHIIGFPRTLNAVSNMNEVFKSRKIKLPLENMETVTDETRYEKGFEIQNPIYGDEIKEKYPDVPEIPKYLTEFGFGDFYTRKGLDIKTRELLVLVGLTTIRSDTQIKAHVLGNIKVGNSKEKLLAVMLQCLPYIGFPNTINTINIIKSI